MATLKRGGNALSAQDKTDIKTGLDLGNVDNTSDASKPVSTAQAAALAGKADTSALGSAAFTASGAYATAAQGTDSREWTAATVTQAEAEAGTDTARKAFTVQRIWQAITKALGGVTVSNTPTTGHVLRATSSSAASWQAPVSGAGIADAASQTLVTADANTTRLPAGTQTYTVDAATAWAVGDGVAVFLPATGTVSFAVSGGPTLNGATTTLTRTLAGNSVGYVVLSRIAGTAAYSLSGV